MQCGCAGGASSGLQRVLLMCCLGVANVLLRGIKWSSTRTAALGDSVILWQLSETVPTRTAAFGDSANLWQWSPLHMLMFAPNVCAGGGSAAGGVSSKHFGLWPLDACQPVRFRYQIQILYHRTNNEYHGTNLWYKICTYYTFVPLHHRFSAPCVACVANVCVSLVEVLDTRPLFLY
jgi:hypothetical protein